MDQYEQFAAYLRSHANDPQAIKNLAGKIDSNDSSLPHFLLRQPKTDAAALKVTPIK